jgi:ABC-type transport system substrate-binding protein
MATFCAVPPTLPPDREGVGAFPGSGPYAITEYVRGKRITLERNRYYGGTRPQRVDRFSVELVDDFQDVLDRIERNEADWGDVPPLFFFDPARQLAGKYGTGKNRRFYSTPGLVSRAFVFNVKRPLFRDNLALRRAVNFAVDRPSLTPGVQSDPSDQYLPRGLPGFKQARLYPLSGPDVRRARALARGHTRGGKAVLLTTDRPDDRAAAQILRQNLRTIGLDLEIQSLPLLSFYPRLAKADFDLVSARWIGAFPDPSDYTNTLFESRFIPSNNVGYFRSAKFDSMMRGAAALSGERRFRAYGEVDVNLARDAAPRVQIAYERWPTFVSTRVDCIVLRPYLDLAAACLK